MSEGATARSFPARTGSFEIVLNRPFLSEKKNNGDSQKTAFNAIRRSLAGTVIMRARQ